jgi:hypothetical protein
VTFIERQPLDLELAKQQWDGYVATLQRNGWSTVVIDGDDAMPDCAFVEDTVVMFGDLAVITNPRQPARNPEIVAGQRVIADLGLESTPITGRRERIPLVPFGSRGTRRACGDPRRRSAADEFGGRTHGSSLRRARLPGRNRGHLGIREARGMRHLPERARPLTSIRIARGGGLTDGGAAGESEVTGSAPECVKASMADPAADL